MNDRRPMGIIYGMSFEEYHAVEAMSATGLREFARSPWHWRNRVPVAETRRMLTGTLTHCAVLEADAMAARYYVMPKSEHKKPTEAQWAAKKPNESSQAAMAWWKEQTEKAGSKIIISADEYHTTRQQLEAIAREPELGPLFARSKCEVSLFWIDPATGIYCKARPDAVDDQPHKVTLVDLKTLSDDTPAGFQRSLSRLGYHRQQAHYSAGYAAITGRRVNDFIFAGVSAAPPILATPYRLVDEAVVQGEDEVRELLAEYAQCLKSDRWPAYTPAERMVDLPRWMKPNTDIEVEIVQ